MTNISAIIIARNVETTIEDCLKCLLWVKEIIVIDNESNDETVNIAKKYSAKVYKVHGLDFSYLRNYGKEKARDEWLLYVDADELISNKLQKEIMELQPNSSRIGAYTLVRKNFYYGVPWPNDEDMVRLIHKDNLIGWQGSLHETPIVKGTVGHLKSTILHYTHKDITQMAIKTNEWSEIEARLHFMNNHPRVYWWRFSRMMLTTFLINYIQNKGFSMVTYGLIESIYQSFSTFITYSKLWEKQNRILVD